MPVTETFTVKGNEVVEKVGEEIFQYLLSEARIVEISSSVVFKKDALEKIIERTRSLLTTGKKLTVAQFRDAFDTTRKSAVALLEYMDDQKVTKRVDDFRILNTG